MAIGSTMQWRIRAGGDNLNGGGFDPGVSGAGTDYTDQDSPQLSLTDLACANSTTLTSVTGGFTTAMKGNVIRIASGTHFTAGYYVITARTDTNTVTLDRNPTDGSSATGGTGRLGGAFGESGGNNAFANLSNGGSQSPTITSPLAAGHTIYVRGSGSDYPSSADYTVANSTYWTWPAGDTTSGPVTWLGYNGVPYIQLNSGGYFAYQATMHTFRGIKWGLAVGGAYLGSGVAIGSVTYIACQVDANGADGIGLSGEVIIDCLAMNSGSNSAGSSGHAAFVTNIYPGVISGCRVMAWRAEGIYCGSYTLAATGNVISNCALGGIKVDTNNYRGDISANTIDSCGGDGIELTTAAGIAGYAIKNNLITNNGGYGINYSTGSTALNDKMKPFVDYNVFNNNTSGPYHNLSAGAHDVIADPDYAADYTPQNPALEGTAFPTRLP